MNHSNSGNEKNCTVVYKYECLDCENYKRKVKEVEQTVSGRDVLIEMLQGEIKKMEDRYKTSIDDYEKLRFKYCTVVQDLGNLKEIHQKLEKSNAKLIKERDIARNHLDILHNEIEKCQKQCKVPQIISSIPSEGDGQIKNVQDSDSLHHNILKEVMNIETIMQNQNETVKEVLFTVLNEMRGKGSKQIEEVLEKEDAYNTYNKIEDPSKEKLLNIIEDLNKKIEELNTIVEHLKIKNETIINELAGKKSNLEQCLDVLEDNHSNLNNLSGDIGMIINEKETYRNETLQLKKIIDENLKTLQKKDKEISELKSKTVPFDEPLEIENMRKKNKDLEKALKECERELEKLQEEYLEKEKQCTIEKCKQLAQVLLEAKNKEDTVKVAGIKSELNSTKVKDNIQEVENKGTDATEVYDVEINLLKERINTLEHDLNQSKLESSEYEEENKSYRQKVENLQRQLQELEKEKLELENRESKTINVAEMKETYETLKSQKENEIKQLKSEINDLKKSSNEDNLKNHLINLQNEMVIIQQKDEKVILSLQDKIDKLENAQYQKQIEIDQCCCVVQNIKETIADKNIIDGNNLVQIKFLEDQKNALQKDNLQLQKYIANLQNEISGYQQKFKDCECTSGLNEKEKGNQEYTTKLQNTVKELETELRRRECLNEKLQNDFKEMEIDICRKQCTINHLEQCLDKSNKILAECEREMKEMHEENENARKENEYLRRDLQNYALDVELSTSEKKELQEKVTRLSRQSQDLEMEKGILSMSLQEKSTIEDELNQTKKMLNNAVNNSKEKDAEIRRLQNALENCKKEYDKIMRNYKEVKETLSLEIKKYKDETERIIKEKDSFNVDLNPNVMELKKLQSLIAEKEKIIAELEQQNRGLAAEVAQLKAYVHKVITDNKNLRIAIDNLLSTLVEKLKSFTDDGERLSMKSNEAIVKDILSSLMDLEQSVMTVNTGGAPIEKCNCMSVIMSTYKIDPKDAKFRNIPPCKQKCGKRIRDVAKYVNSKLSSTEGIVSACRDCCGNKEKGQDDKPE